MEAIRAGGKPSGRAGAVVGQGELAAAGRGHFAGGDEFVLVSYGHSNEDAVSAELQRMRDMLSRPFDVDGREIYVTGSVGVVLYPQDGKSVDELLRNAEAAMCRANTRPLKLFVNHGDGGCWSVGRSRKRNSASSTSWPSARPCWRSGS